MCWLDLSSLLGFLFHSAAHLSQYLGKHCQPGSQTKDVQFTLQSNLLLLNILHTFVPAERVHDLCYLTVDIYLPFLSFPPLFLSFMILIPEWPITVSLLFLHTLGMTSFMLISGFLCLSNSSKPLFSFTNSLCCVAARQRSYLCLCTQLLQHQGHTLLCASLGLTKESINQMLILQGAEVRPHFSAHGLGGKAWPHGAAHRSTQ